jgi:hypothetical protein
MAVADNWLILYAAHTQEPLAVVNKEFILYLLRMRKLAVEVVNDPLLPRMRKLLMVVVNN